MAKLNWSGEIPYHVSRPSKGVHYSIEFVEAPVSYFELRGVGVFPFRKFLTLSDAKEAAQRIHDTRRSTSHD
ncbi:hypothetical protein GGQ64_005365 [Rhizobium azooxidifex]|uniref:Uncharacterized protein n=1 Tax=Mycoplana azooxidifex TaxID=1636188 RepID=A0A7W6GMC1_9HYPH|nr:hypothetical protein [Mycoplana azooxidifex]MBB3980118.1 hypothetical protein [Mycoplana azooxidifex]